MSKAIFLDRDGTINLDPEGYISAPEKLVLLPHVTEALKKLKTAGFLLIVISNQSGIGRGLYTLSDYERVTERMHQLLKAEGLVLDDVYYCPHSPESNCACRKPATKMIMDAAEKWKVDRAQSYMVGDKQSDIQAGNDSGAKTFLISTKTPPPSFGQTHTISNLLDLLEIVLRDS